MKHLIKELAICLIVLFLYSIGSHAQQFKWVKGGGTDQDLSSLGGASAEQSEYMCTDLNGNIYTLNQIGTNAIIADTFHRTTGAYGASHNIFVTSYTSNGLMRWAKLIASSGDCFPYGMQVDNIGNLYIAGYFQHLTGLFHIGNDTTLTIPTYQANGIIQLDTNGNYKWIRYVGTNSTSTGSGTYSFGSTLAIDGANNAHFLHYTKNGVHITSTLTSIGGTYDLVYDRYGNLLSSLRIDLDSEWYFNSVVIDPATNKLYACGAINQGIFGGFLTDTCFVAAFDASRNRLWQYFTGNDTMGSTIAALTLDENKRLHIVGDAISNSLSLSTYFYFNGDTAYNTHYSHYAMAVIMTIDTNGHPLKITKFDGSLAISALGAITQLPNGKVAAIGTYAGEVIGGSFHIITPAGEAQNPYLVIVDSAGDVQTIQQLHGNGFSDGGTAITSDRFGNIYLGGYVADSIWAGSPSIPAYHSIGGNSDFYVMKYGMDLSCTTTPLAYYSDTGTHIVGFNYAGTTVGIDSVNWYFGDGTSSNLMNPMHTYTAIGTFRACVIVYSGCGNDIYCQDVRINIPSLSNPNAPILGNISIYPNPTKYELSIKNADECKIEIINLLGQVVYHQYITTNNQLINIARLPESIYVVMVIDKKGNTKTLRLQKE